MGDKTEKREFFSNKLKNLGKRISIYFTFILIGIVLSSYYFTNYAAPAMIKVLKAGEVSVSINERNELIFINRDRGEPLMVDSTLTKIINQILAAQEYLRTNTVDKRITQLY
jgi:hypothetical protein